MHRVLRRTKHDDVYKVDVTAKMCSSIVILCAFLALTSAIEDTLGIIHLYFYSNLILTHATISIKNLKRGNLSVSLASNT